jgi:fucose permease
MLVAPESGGNKVINYYGDCQVNERNQKCALLIMGISGGPFYHCLFGIISHQANDLQIAYIVGLPCYLFTLFYSLAGHKIRRWR